MNKHTILCVDDEQSIINALKRLLRREDYNLITVNSGNEGLKILEERPVDLVVSDHRMSEMSGVEFLSRVKERFPDVIRIILSGYTEVDSITAAINEGNIYKFILKPWNDEDLKVTIRHSLEHHDLFQENKKLYVKIKEKNEALEGLNQKLEHKVAKRTQELLLQNQALQLAYEILEKLPIAVLGIGDDGMVAFINKTAEKIYGDGNRTLLTLDIHELFPESIHRLIKEAMDLNRATTLNSYTYRNRTLSIECLPFNDHNRGKGVIMTSIEEKRDGND